MLKTIFIENVGAMKSKTYIDFSKEKFTYKENMIDKSGVDVNPHAFFGSNASGKTCFLRVFDIIQSIMNSPIDQVKLFLPYLDVPLIEESKVVLTFVFDELEYVYEIITSMAKEIVVER